MYITSTGMICPTGLEAASACAAMRAGIAAFEELPYLDNQGKPIIGSHVTILDGRLKREERLIELLSLAITDCLENAKYDLPIEDVPLLVGMAEPDRENGGAKLPARIIGEMEQKLNVRFHSTYSRAFNQGHVSGFLGLRIARDLMKERKVPACIVCGVDSYIDAGSLAWLDKLFRLKTDENSDGMIPGEGAASVLLQPQPLSGIEYPVKIAGLGFGYEKASVSSEDPLLGIGLSDAARSALGEAGLQMHEIHFRLSDVTGESYGFKEQSIVIGRLIRVHREEGFPLLHCAEYIGNTGAAAGIIELIVSFHAYQKRYNPGDIAICFTSADSGKRAVSILRSGTGIKI